MQASQQKNKLSPDSQDPPSGGQKKSISPAQHWLTIQCHMIQGAHAGLLFRVHPDAEHVELEASWPNAVPSRTTLTKKIKITAETGKAHLEKVPNKIGAEPTIRVYHPIPAPAPSRVSLVVVLELSDRDDAERRTVAKLLRWNSEWLKFSVLSAPSPENNDLSRVFATALACLDQGEFRPMAMALVTELSSGLRCQRVSLGLRKRNAMEVQAVSHSARFKHESNLIQSIAAAMDEAVDQDRPIVHPAEKNAQTSAITYAHEELAKALPNGSVCTIPIAEQGQVIGALTLERESGPALSQADIAFVEQVLAVVSPVLWLKRADEQSLPVKAWRSGRDTLSRVAGPGHVKAKLFSGAAIVLLLFFAFATGQWRVTADAVVEGSVQRSIAAPIDGYIASADSRAGDVVERGQVLGSLDDSDLRLERLKWSTLRQQMVSESREAMAQHNRAEVGIINAKIEQANAELKLIDEQLARITLVAPFSGIVIEGDLSQLLGTPVTRGDVLFKVAPLDDYRIVLKVDEQDIAPIAAGQSGSLILASMPERQLALAVTKVTPVSTAEDGRNFFRVEAKLSEAKLSLQPGMEGVGKIAVGDEKLIWIWSRKLVNWLRLQTWAWWR